MISSLIKILQIGILAIVKGLFAIAIGALLIILLSVLVDIICNEKLIKRIFITKYLRGNYFDAFKYIDGYAFNPSDVFQLIRENNIAYSEFLLVLKNYANFMRKFNESWSSSMLNALFYITVQHYCNVHAPDDEKIDSLWDSDKTGEEVLKELDEKMEKEKNEQTN